VWRRRYHVQQRVSGGGGGGGGNYRGGGSGATVAMIMALPMPTSPRVFFSSHLAIFSLRILKFLVLDSILDFIESSKAICCVSSSTSVAPSAPSKLDMLFLIR